MRDEDLYREKKITDSLEAFKWLAVIGVIVLGALALWRCGTVGP